MVEQAGGDATLYRTAIGALCAVIVFETGIIVKLAKIAWDSAMARVQDQKDIEKSVKAKKEGSP